MTCKHLQQLYQLCRDHNLKVGGTDLVRFICEECGAQEVCPSLLMEEYEAQEEQRVAEADSDQENTA